MTILRSPWLPAALLSLAGAVHPWLEASMATHMLLELPLLFVIGWLAARAAGGAQGGRWRGWQAYRLPMLLAALLATSVWMLPVALDYAVLHPGAMALKVVSLLAAGFLCGVSWGPAGVVLQGFFVFNWAWMTVTAGLLYQDAPQQLCSVYLSEQQGMAGIGLVTLGAALLTLWLLDAIVLPALADSGEEAEVHPVR